MPKGQLAFVIKSLAAHGGGAERVAVDLARELQALDWEVQLVSFDDPDDGAFYNLPEGVAWRKLGRHPWARGKTGIVDRALRIRAYVGHARLSVLVAFMSSSIVPTILARIPSRVPVLASEHASLAYYKGKALELRLLATSARRAKAISFVSQEVMEEFGAEMKRANSLVLPNPVALSREAQQVRTKRIVAAGSLTRIKRFDVLLESFARLSPDFPDWTLCIYGDGPERARLEAARSELGLAPEIASLPGFAHNLRHEFASAGIVASTSDVDSFGMILAEAMSEGAPVIGSALSIGARSLITSGTNGILFGQSTTPLPESLHLLMRDTVLRDKLAEQGKLRAAEYSPSKVAGLWDRALMKLRKT